MEVAREWCSSESKFLWKGTGEKQFEGKEQAGAATRYDSRGGEGGGCFCFYDFGGAEQFRLRQRGNAEPH